MPVRQLQFLFRLTLVGFLAGGVLLVLGQTLGLVVGDAGWVAAVEEHAGPPTFVVAGICGLIAFLLSYLTPEKTEDGSGPAKDLQPAGSTRP
ncbi:hypothetical protein ACFZCM_24580 [Streptomyces rochei]|uniref:hypothetical protein n=1 Tax=Streptomyces rochei TaxID=1928 RepID=UPI0036E40363